jgi:hypothetical protein
VKNENLARTGAQVTAVDGAGRDRPDVERRAVDRDSFGLEAGRQESDRQCDRLRKINALVRARRQRGQRSHGYERTENE